MLRKIFHKASIVQPNIELMLSKCFRSAYHGRQPPLRFIFRKARWPEKVEPVLSGVEGGLRQPVRGPMTFSCFFC